MDCTRDLGSDHLRVLMLPWLAHGHLTPFLELGKRLSSRGFRVYLCSTPANLASFRKEDTGGVELLELHLPELPELPAHLHTTKNLPSHRIPDLMNVFDLSEPSFGGLLDSLRPGLVVYDIFQPWAAATARRRQIPAVLFVTNCCATHALACHIVAKREEEFPFRSMLLNKDIADPGGRYIMQVIAHCVELSSSFVLIRTSGETEGKYLDYVSLLKKKEHVPVGTLVGDPRRNLGNETQRRRLTPWLDDKPQSSVAFVSFGSEYFMSKEEMAEIARGLELSGVNFIWVIRFPKGKEVPLEDALPEGFLGRNSEKGMFADGWAPQEEILAHPAVGVFVTHCGWGSVLEALQWGVPIVAMPQQYDQPTNANFIAELGAGIKVSRDYAGADAKRSYRGNDLAAALKNVVTGEGSKELKKRTREIAENLRRKGDAEVDAAARKLAELIHPAGPPARHQF